ncbi:TIGR03619 family F420-dependent LLM class oxidoreductase [Nonomuraea zeae]|uniref:TIGR03619 family F420-dependent LLM class oxidoreductase n=1 Tax=Nonomuraea zeae TaxID=1642303 RepID=UPI001478BC7F|nr:TIGR03619 family F420-dependent LLM class oxidoreductase [Nonomuraea zeae]
MPPAIGLHLLNAFATADRRGAARIARLAEDLGYESLWVADHVVLPAPRVESSPLDPDAPLLDPLVSLAFLAAHTDRILLGTGCIVLPQRHPLILAKQLAGIDVLSEGRLIAGLAAGYLEPELRALGVPPEERGTRTAEFLRAMRALWEGDGQGFAGRHISFQGVVAHPRPLQRPLPVIMGGHSTAALKRSVELADGWYGWMLGTRATADHLKVLRELSGGRRLHVSISPPRRATPDVVAAYADLGVDRLILVPPLGLTLDDLAAFVKQHAP